MTSAPNYVVTSLNAFWATCYPQISKTAPLIATPDAQANFQLWRAAIEGECKTAKEINSTFQVVDPNQCQALFDQAAKTWNNYANITFELVNDPAQANVRLACQTPT